MEENQENNKFRRISKITAGFMIVIAIFYDVLELGIGWIPIAGQVSAVFINLFAMMHFVLWFKLKGVNMGSPKAVLKFWLPNLGGVMFPFLAFILTTIGVILTIGLVWAEDITKISVPSKKGLRKGLRKKNVKKLGKRRTIELRDRETRKIRTRRTIELKNRNSNRSRILNKPEINRKPKVSQRLPPTSE